MSRTLVVAVCILCGSVCSGGLIEVVVQGRVSRVHESKQIPFEFAGIEAGDEAVMRFFMHDGAHRSVYGVPDLVDTQTRCCAGAAYVVPELLTLDIGDFHFEHYVDLLFLSLDGRLSTKTHQLSTGTNPSEALRAGMILRSSDYPNRPWGEPIPSFPRDLSNEPFNLTGTRPSSGMWLSRLIDDNQHPWLVDDGTVNMQIDTVTQITYPAGDANKDGVFDQADMVQVLQRDRYLDGFFVSWSQGDFTGDGRFDQMDIVEAMPNWQAESVNATAVPEPATVFLLITGIIVVAYLRGRRNE